jgi:ureidoglycolate lyase
MKLLRLGPPGQEKPALLDADGRARDLSAHVTDIGGDVLSPAGLAALRALDPASLPLLPDGLRAGPCVGGIGKIIGIGLNYADHAAEAGLPVPAEPILFMKPTSSLAGADDPLPIPPGSTKTDWEVELAVVIGRRAQRVSDSEALSFVAGYAVANDVSEREWQLERGGTWDKGKAHDGFCPLGPWLVTADEAGDPQALALWLDVDGAPRQRGRTATMVFGVAPLVAYVSCFMTLHPGDVILTGTPPGVGLGMKPPQFLRPGQVVTLGIERLGAQRQVTVAG